MCPPSLESGQTAAQPVRVQEVGEGFLAVDEDDWDALAVPALELGVAGDVDLLELERNLGSDLGEHAACALAEVTARCAEERDPVRSRGRAHE
jgi:hypothetical protein